MWVTRKDFKEKLLEELKGGKEEIRREFGEVKKAVCDEMAAVAQAASDRLEEIVCGEPKFEDISRLFSMPLMNGATQPSPPDHHPANMVTPPSLVIPAQVSPPASICSSPSAIRTHRKPQDFDGKVSLEAYLAQFEVLALAHGMSKRWQYN